MQPPLSASNPIVLEARGKARAKLLPKAGEKAKAKARARVTRAGERDGIIFHLLFPEESISSVSPE